MRLNAIRPLHALAIRRRAADHRLVCRALLVAGLVAGGVVPARAAGFDLEFWKPASPSTGYFNEDSPRILPFGASELGLAFGYARRPLVIRNQMTGAPNGDVVSDRHMAFLSAGVGITDWADVGLRVPAVVRQAGDVDVAIAGEGGVPGRPRARALGDIEVLLRMRVVGRATGRQPRLTLAAPFAIPTGAGDAFAGNGAVSFRPRLILGWESRDLSAAVSAGYEFRRAAEVPSSNVVIGNAIAAGAGVAYALLDNQLWLLGEVSTWLGTQPPQTGGSNFSTQAMLGARVKVGGNFVVQAGAGTGLTRAVGSPRFRALLTLSYTWGLG